VVSELLTKSVIEFGDDKRFKDFFKLHGVFLLLEFVQV